MCISSESRTGYSNAQQTRSFCLHSFQLLLGYILRTKTTFLMKVKCVSSHLTAKNELQQPLTNDARLIFHFEVTHIS